MSQYGLDTKFMMPGWWVRAFEAITRQQTRLADPFELSASMGLFPALNHPEMNALGSLLHQTQSLLLDGRKDLEIRVVDHVKSSPYQGANQRFAYDRILQLLGGAHLAAYNQDRQARTRPLFKGFRMDFDRPQQEWSIHFKVDPDNQELIFGYLDPYAELMRLWHRQELNFKYCGSRPPLRLWRPIWLELQGFDQTLFLRLEQAAQWQKRELRLDGVFGESFDCLFESLPIMRKKRHDERIHPFFRKWQVLKRLGRRLMDHGLLVEGRDYDYCSLPDQVSPVFLGWQMAPHYQRDLSRRMFEQAVVTRFNHVLKIAEMVRILSGSMDSSRLKTSGDWQRFWQEAATVEADYGLVCTVEDAFLVNARIVFVEYVLRMQAAHPLPVPEPLAGRLDGTIFDLNQDLLKSYESFVLFLVRQEDPARELSHWFAHSVANPKNQSHPKVLDHIVAGRTGRTPATPKSEVKVAGASEIKSEGGGNRQYAMVSPEQSVTDESPSSSRQNLRQQADEELKRLRHKEPDNYQKLKNAYLRTLDQEKKKIILEVKERLQPDVFDDHLKHSLVKFMVENPNYWRPSTMATR
jgi:hypothetical protein